MHKLGNNWSAGRIIESERGLFGSVPFSCGSDSVEPVLLKGWQRPFNEPARPIF